MTIEIKSDHPALPPATCSVLELREMVATLRKQNSALQRRCQQAESAVRKVKAEWEKHGGPKGGSFGRALLACYCADLERKLETQNIENRREPTTQKGAE